MIVDKSLSPVFVNPQIVFIRQILTFYVSQSKHPQMIFWRFVHNSLEER